MATTAEHGMLRTEVDYAWPAIFRPAYEVKLVYLDLNQWIGLAKAASVHKDGARYVQALEAARAAKDAGTAMFPLSGTHYMELAGIGSFRHRSDIAGVMEELSDFSTILSRAVLTKCEVEAALTARVGSRPDLYSPLTLLNFGVGPAFGMVGGLRFRNRAGRDVTEEARLEHPDGPEEFDRMLREMNIKLERAMLRGPSPHEAEELRSAGGWDPTVAREIATERGSAGAEAGREPQLQRRWSQLATYAAARRHIGSAFLDRPQRADSEWPQCQEHRLRGRLRATFRGLRRAERDAPLHRFDAKLRRLRDHRDRDAPKR
jgi:hypothetical protein